MSEYALTPNLGLYQPTVDADDDMWGSHLNDNATTLDTIVGSVVNALHYGADPTGATDSAAAINAAAAEYMDHAGYKTVYLPAGKYYIRSPLILPGTTLLGDGVNNTVISAGDDFQDGAAGVVILEGRERTSSGVRNLTIAMTEPLEQVTTASAATAGSTTITLASAANVFVDDYVVNATAAASIVPFTKVTAIAGTVVTISPAVAAPGVGAGNSLKFSPSRDRFKTLAAGGTAGFGGNSGVRYPPVINANECNRFELQNLWITGAWDGVVQNSAITANGGGHLHNVSVSAFNTGFDFDNLKDFLSMSDIRFGGFTISNVVAGQQGGVFMDGQTVAFKFGRIDGMAITNAVVWIGKLWWTAASASSQDPHIISSLVVDAGAIQADNTGTLLLNGLTMVGSSFGQSRTVPLITLTLGRMTINGGHVVQNSEVAPCISIAGGSLNVGGGAYLCNEGVAQPVVDVPAGAFSMSGGVFVNHNASATSVPLVRQSGTGSVVLKGVTFGGGTGNPAGVSFATDTAGNSISDLALGIYKVTLPAATALGDYGQVLRINGAIGSQREVRFQSAGLTRFLMRVTPAAESGSNAGSNLAFDAFADNGTTLIGTVFSIARATGGLSLNTLAASTSYASDAAAAAGGVTIGQLYRNGSAVMVRVA